MQVCVARASLFTAQAIALDMIAADRQYEVDRILERVATFRASLPNHWWRLSTPTGSVVR